MWSLWQLGHVHCSGIHCHGQVESFDQSATRKSLFWQKKNKKNKTAAILLHHKNDSLSRCTVWIIVSKFAASDNVQKSWSQLVAWRQMMREIMWLFWLRRLSESFWVKAFFCTVTKCNSVVNTKLPMQGTGLKLTQGVQSNILLQSTCFHLCVLERFHLFMQNSLYQRIIRFSSLSEFSNDTKRHWHFSQVRHNNLSQVFIQPSYTSSWLPCFCPPSKGATKPQF